HSPSCADRPWPPTTTVATRGRVHTDGHPYAELMDDSAALVISAHGLVKKFGNLRALDGLDLEVRQGEVHGFLGPNGAGKSTTIRVLLGLLRADGGTATLLGGDP